MYSCGGNAEFSAAITKDFQFEISCLIFVSEKTDIFIRIL